MLPALHRDPAGGGAHCGAVPDCLTPKPGPGMFPSRRLRLLALLTPMAVACSDDVNAGGRLSTSPTSSQVATVAVTPETILLAPGDTTRLVAVTRDAAGAPLLGRVVAWSSETPAIATVSTSGLVTAVAAGNVRITATSEGRSGSATITAVR